MSIDVLKKSRIYNKVQNISNLLIAYTDKNIIKESELQKILELVHDKEKLMQLIQYL